MFQMFLFGALIQSLKYSNLVEELIDRYKDTRISADIDNT